MIECVRFFGGAAGEGVRVCRGGGVLSLCMAVFVWS